MRKVKKMNDKGFSLVEVMIFASIMAVVSVAMTKLIQSQSKEQKALRNRMDMDNVFNDIKAKLRDNDNCRYTFSQAGFSPASVGAEQPIIIYSGARYFRPEPNASGMDRYGKLDLAGTAVYQQGNSYANNTFEIDDISARVVDYSDPNGRAKVEVTVSTVIDDDKLVYGFRNRVSKFNIVLNLNAGNVVACSNESSDNSDIIENGCPQLIVNNSHFNIFQPEDIVANDYTIYPDLRAAEAYSPFYDVTGGGDLPQECQYIESLHADWFNSDNLKTPNHPAYDPTINNPQDIPSRNEYNITETYYHTPIVGMQQNGRAQFGFYKAFQPCERPWNAQSWGPIHAYDWVDDPHNLYSNQPNSVVFNGSNEADVLSSRSYVSGIVVGFHPFTGEAFCQKMGVVADVNIEDLSASPRIEMPQFRSSESSSVLHRETNFPATSDVSLCPPNQHIIGYNFVTHNFICRQDLKSLYDVPYSDEAGSVLVADNLDNTLKFRPFRCKEGEGWNITGLAPDGTVKCDPGYFENGCQINTYVEGVNPDGSVRCAPLPAGIQATDPAVNEYIIGLDSAWLVNSFPTAACSPSQELQYRAGSWSCVSKALPFVTCSDGSYFAGYDENGAAICLNVEDDCDTPSTTPRPILRSFAARDITVVSPDSSDHVHNCNTISKPLFSDVSGDVVGATFGDIRISPNSINSGEAIASFRQITITNDGPAYTDVSLDATNPDCDGLYSPASCRLSSGQSCIITVEFESTSSLSSSDVNPCYINVVGNNNDETFTINRPVP